MSVVLLLLAGLMSDVDVTGQDCIDTLHGLRTELRLEIVATDVLEDNVIAYTLTDGPRRSDNTAFLVCERTLDEGDDGEVVEELPEEMGAPIDEPAASDEGTTSEPAAQ